MKLVKLMLILLLLIGCGTHRVPGFYGGDGSSLDQAVEIVGYEYASYDWIQEHYPGAEVIGQELVIPPDGDRFDVLTIKAIEGDTIKLWFLLSGDRGSIWD
ncbi:hypothetical protein K8T06_13680 [bacterium]|nr:hypothetical protein [bacterium]